ncbi:WD40-repeat-containing domain protein [Syncephalis plumigaleata]|nr:WD40-repeat-containing domain protein [Syncephalis plumigaleata]
MTTPQWQTLVADRLHARDTAIKPQIELCKAYHSLNAHLTQYMIRNVELEQVLTSLTHEHQQLQSSSSVATAEQCQLLEKELARMREEAEQLRQLHNETQKRLIEQHEQLKEARVKESQAQTEIAQLNDELKVQISRVDMQREQLREKDITVQVLQDELSTAQLELYKMDERTKSLEQENKQLLDRWLKKMNQEADDMNAVILVDQPPKIQVSNVNVVEDLTKSPTLRERALTSIPPTMLSNTISAHKEQIHDMAVSEDGAWLVTGGGDNLVKLWNARKGSLLRTLTGCTRDVMCVSFNMAGSMVLAGSNDNIIHLWEPETGRQLASLTGHVGKVYSAVFNSYGTQVVSGGHDRAIKIWDLSKGYCNQTIFSPSSCNSVVQGDYDGTVLVSGHVDSVIRFWDSRTGKCFKELAQLHTGQITSVTVARDGHQLLTVARDNNIIITDTRTFKPVCTLSHDKYRTGSNWSKAIFSPDGRYAMAGSASGNVFIWNIDTAECEQLDQHKGSVNTVCWAPFDTCVASADATGSICVWK